MPPATDESAEAIRPLRKDAQRSRKQVLVAAKELYAERGLHVGFDEIARRAGVGVGTVYRRFPDRDALVEALFTEKLEQLLAIGEAAARVPDPWEALVNFCERLVEELHHDRGLMQVLLSAGLDDERHHQARDQLNGSAGRILGRAQDAGSVRADLDPLDLALIAHLVSQVTLNDGTELWRRYLGLFMEAIREQPGRPELSSPTPTVAMFEEIARRP